MGNQQQMNQIQYEVVKKEQHPVLGAISTVRVDFGGKKQLCTMKSHQDIDVEQINGRIGWLMARQNHPSCKHVLKKIYAQSRDIGESCASVGRRQVFYQLLQSDLDVEYYNRKTAQRAFEQKEVLKILNDCLLALRLQEDIGLRFYHICRSSIIKSKNDNWALIAQQDTELSHPMYLYRQEFSSQLLGKNYCLSPQLLLSYSDKDSHGEVTVQDQLFSLGCVVLSLCQMGEVQLESEAVSIGSNKGQKYFVFEQPRLRRQVDRIRSAVRDLANSQKIKKILLDLLGYLRQDRPTLDSIITLLNEETTRPINSMVASKSNLSFSQRKHSIQTQTATKADSLHSTRNLRGSSEAGKKVIDVYLESRQSSNQKKPIATGVKQYKNQKMSRDTSECKPIKSVISQEFVMEKSRPSLQTPVKALVPFESTNSPHLRNQAHPRQLGIVFETSTVGSKYQLVSVLNPQSRRSMTFTSFSKINFQQSLARRR